MQRRITIDRDRAAQLVGELLAVAVGLEQRFIKRNHEGPGSDVGIVDDFHVQGAVAQSAVGMDRHRDHAGRLTRHSANGGGAVFGEGADGLGGVDDLEGIQRGSQGRHDIRLGHGNGDIAVAGDGMPAGQYLVRIDVGHGAGGGDLQITPNQQGAHSRTRQEGEQTYPLMCHRRSTAAQAGNGRQSPSRKRAPGRTGLLPG